MPRKRPRLFGIIKEPIEVISEKDRLSNHLSCILIHLMFLINLTIILSPIIAYMFFDTIAFLSITKAERLDTPFIPNTNSSINESYLTQTSLLKSDNKSNW